MEKKTYIGTYKVFKVFRVSGRRQILRRGLSRNEAIRLTDSYPNLQTNMVCFDKQFYADKYFI